MAILPEYCPRYEINCSVAPDLIGLKVACPNCTQGFAATPPDWGADLQLPDAIPFSKSGKLKILKNISTNSLIEEN